MAFITPVFFNLTTGKFVESYERPTVTNPPQMVYGDVPSFQMKFLENTPRGVSVKSSTGVGLQIMLATEAGSVLSSATAGTPVSDVYPVDLNLTGSTVGDAAPTLPSKLKCVLQFVFTVAGLATTRTATVFLEKRAGSVTVVDPDAPLAYITTADLKSFAVPKDGTNDSADVKIWTSQDGTKKRMEYLGNDGQMHNDPIAV